MSEYNTSDYIAIIGIGCRFPGAADKNAFWNNLKTGADVLVEYTDEELLSNGVSPATLSDPDYVKFGYPINDIESFDAEFFGYSAAEAMRMDPQQRLFLQCAWSALEDGGEAGEKTARTGVFASAKMSSYLDTQVDPDTIGTSAAFGTLIGNDKDYIATRTSFKLGLTGPSITVQSACSSSLAAVHMAVQSLLAGECDKAIAGGASITIPQRIGYTYEEGMICSPDAKCRAFDKNAQGICAGNGVGAVLLKPLEDAQRDKNNIYAVIRGSAMNNDGADKAGFTAPSISGQSEVILDALSLAGVSARDIGYLEAHGTGTALGDPIEIQALTTAYRKYTQDCEYCAIASVKSNVGHLDTAAGICSLIKTSMALSHGEMPPSLHFSEPNPRIPFNTTPFQPITELKPWPAIDGKRFAGISSFGVGGSNIHMILEGPPFELSSETVDGPEGHKGPFILPISAKNEDSLSELCSALADFLRNNHSVSPASIMRTLCKGRRHFKIRTAMAGKTPSELIEKLQAPKITKTDGKPPKIGFMFTGQGSQYAGMGQELYRSSKIFHRAIDTVAEVMQTYLDHPLLDILFEEKEYLADTKYAQPAIFAIEYGLYKYWLSLGVKPHAVTGHSIGEFAAACASGVMSLENAAFLICNRGSLCASLPSGGGMTAFFASREELENLIHTNALEGLDVAAINGPKHTVLAGPVKLLNKAENIAEKHDILFRSLNVSHAFHSRELNPVINKFKQLVNSVELCTPDVYYISCLTGQNESEILSTCEYWTDHLRSPVQFIEGARALLDSGCDLIMEIGPNAILEGMAKRFLNSDTPILTSMRKDVDSEVCILETVSALYSLGTKINWDHLLSKKVQMASIPTYHFRKDIYWAPRSIDKDKSSTSSTRKITTPSQVKLPFELLRKQHPIPTFKANIDIQRIPALQNHIINGKHMAPLGILATLMTDAWKIFKAENRVISLKNIQFHSPVLLSGETPAAVHILPEENGKISIFQNKEGKWINCTSAEVAKAQPEIPCPKNTAGAGTPFSPDMFPSSLKGLGKDSEGNRLWKFEDIRTSGNAVHADIILEKKLIEAGGGLAVHPSLIDPAIQLLGAFPEIFKTPCVLTPITSRSISFRHSHGEKLHCLISLHENTPEYVRCSINLQNHEKKEVLYIENLKLIRIAETADSALPDTEPKPELTFLSWQQAVSANRSERHDNDIYPIILFHSALPQLTLNSIGEHPVNIENIHDFNSVLFEKLDKSPNDSELNLIYASDSPNIDDHVHFFNELAKYGKVRSLIVTSSGALSIAGEETKPIQRAVWELARVFAAENPQTSVRCIDLNHWNALEEGVLCLLDQPEITGQCAYRLGQLMVPVLRKINKDEPVAKIRKNLLKVPEKKTALIIGATGGLGRALIKKLVQNDCRSLLLTSRRQPSLIIEKEWDELRKQGVQIRFHGADISIHENVAKLLQNCGDRMPELGAVYHLAGESSHAPLTKLSPAEFQIRTAAKLKGAKLLHELTTPMRPDIFVMFSSISALNGVPKAGAYSAANGYLEALAEMRRSQGLPSTCISWGPFRDSGMLKEDSDGHEQRKSLGIHALNTDNALELLESIPQSIPVIHATANDWPLFYERMIALKNKPWFRLEEDSAQKKDAESGLTHEKADSSSADQISYDDDLESFISQSVAELLKSSEPPSAEDNLLMSGLDSLLFLQLAQKLRKKIGVRISPPEVFSNPTIKNICHLVRKKNESSIRDSPKSANTEKQKVQSFELTDTQYAYWAGRSSSLPLGNVSCHSYAEYNVKNLDRERYSASWNTLIKRHPMLRMIITSDGMQSILPDVPPLEIKHHDLRDFSDNVRGHRISEIRNELSHKVHDTSNWPLFSVQTIQIAADVTRICVSIDLLFADARSLQILMRELRDIYEASSDSQSPEQLCDQGFFKELEYNFKQYIADHKQWEKSEEGQETLKAASDYWDARLPELPHGPDLPLASTPEEVSRPVFNQHLATIPEKKWRTIKEKAKAKNLTPSLLLMAVYSDVLGRWSNSKDFCLNVTLFNRQPYHPQVNDIIGDFTNLSLLEVKHDPKKSFLERAMAIRDQFWKDMEYSSLSGVEVIRRLTRAGRLSFGESYPVVFTSNISGDSGPRLLEAMGERGFNISQTPQVWLDNQVHQEQGNLVIHWDSVDELFYESMIDDMLSAYVKILESLADNDSAWSQQSFDILPQRTISLIESINETKTDIPQHTLFSLFQKGCRHKPDAPAIITSKGQWTYKNIAGYAEAVARWLEEKEVETGYPVGVCLPKGVLQIAAVLGVCATGAAFVPIDHELPELRREALLEEAELEILLTEDIISSLPAVSTDEELLKRSPSAPGELAYVIYTSGSTGKPKGVAISHEAAVNTILDINRRYKISSNDRIFGVSRLSFDLSVYDIFGAFAAGAALILPDDESQRDPAHWLDCLSTHKCTVWNSAPALLQLAIEYAESNGQQLPCMKTVMLSGDKISPDLPLRMKKLSPEAEIHSLGGATEAAIWSICLPISNHKPSDGPIPYGRPMDNQQWYVLDGSLHPCPENVQGDLYIGGKGLAIGYYNDRTRTAKTFIRHPETGKRLYRTGDLGSMTGSGMLTIAGRRDFQVKVNGHRVEPSEIEHILSSHPDVASLSVAATHIEGNVRLVCHYVGSIKEEDLRDFASGRLPRYMIPSNFMRLDSFPVTPSGKIDRKALPTPLEEMDSTAGTEKDMTETEQAVAKIWNRLLQRESTHPETDFFSAGGDSVLAARMTLELGKSFKTEFALPRFFESPTIRGLAKHFQKRDAILSRETDIHGSSGSKKSNKNSNLVDILHTSVLAKHHSANSIGSIIPNDFSGYNTSAPTEIKRPFLTGATGFVGSHLLASLLSRGMDKVFCLVRAQSEAIGIKRLLETASSYGLNLKDDVQRIEVILGDLTEKRFGMPQKNFNRLSEATDAIFHAGALVHYIYSYETLIPPNVQGVREAVRLACTGRAKHLHHVSTVSVFSPIRAEPSLKVYEEESIEQDMQVFGGYPQSKWIAEKVLNLAAEQGVGISIYRPGLVTGSSRTGGWNKEDFLYRIVKGSIQAGCFPDLDRTENFLPVDAVANAIVHIALGNSEKRFFTIDGFNPVKASTLFEAMNKYGAGLEMVSYEEWRSRINAEGNALLALLPIFPRQVDPEKISKQLVFDNTNSKKALRDSSVRFPDLDELLPLYLRTLLS